MGLQFDSSTVLHARTRSSRWFCRAVVFAAAIILFSSVHAKAQNVFFGSLFTGSPPPDSLFTCDPNGLGLTNILPAPGGPVSVDVDPASQTVFWSDLSSSPGQWQIRSASFSGGSPSVVATYANPGDAYGLAADPVNQRLYWSDGSTIRRSNYNGSGLTTVVSGLGNVQAIEVDPVAGKIFWAARGTTAEIGSANLDGTSPQTLLSLATGTIPSGITVDPATQTIFFSSLVGGTISTLPYSGGSATQLMSGLSAPAGLDLEPVLNRLYVVQKNARSVGWTTPAGVGFTTIFTGGGEMFDVATIVPEPHALAMLGILFVVGLRSIRFKPVR